MDATTLSDNTAKSSRRIAVDSGAEPGDWQTIYDRLNRRAISMASVLTKTSAAGGTFLGIFAVAGILTMIVEAIHPRVSPYYLACFVLPPALLAGAAAGQASGNLFLRAWFGLGEATRRGFAARLTLARAPAEWPSEVARWLFAGDWLETPSLDHRLPYARLFIMGSSPATCREEDELWREVHDAVSCGSLLEPGANHREISYPRQLPAWARQVGRGDGLDELATRIGAGAANEWATHLRRRASRQWPILGSGGTAGMERRECFELHSLALSGGREALLVVLRPAGFVDEAAAHGANRQAA